MIFRQIQYLVPTQFQESIFPLLTCLQNFAFGNLCLLDAWMKEARDKTSSRGAYLRCPVSTSVHFSLRNEGSSEYKGVCEGRESLSLNL
jgi:hypothetical protein